jgi:hypothetical protein
MKNKQDRQTPANTSKRITKKHRNYHNKQARNDKVKANISIANHLKANIDISKSSKQSKETKWQ